MRMFYRTVGSTTICYDDTAGVIRLSMPMYSKEKLTSVSTEVSICEEEWKELVKYGREAGWIDP